VVLPFEARPFFGLTSASSSSLSDLALAFPFAGALALVPFLGFTSSSSLSSFLTFDWGLAFDLAAVFLGLTSSSSSSSLNSSLSSLTFDLGFAFDLAAAFLGLTSSSASASLSTFAFEVDALPFFGLTSTSASPLAALLFFAAFLGLGSSSSSFSSTSGFLAESGISSSSTVCQLSSMNQPTFSFLECDFDLTSARLTIDVQFHLLSLAYPHFFVSFALHV
jgi:hypothetical protein